MRYEIISTRFLLEQIEKYDKKTKRVLYKKKQLIAVNPFRNKSVETPSYKHAFSVKFSDKREDKRLVYVVVRSRVFLCFVLDRSKGYKDLEAFFKRIGRLD